MIARQLGGDWIIDQRCRYPRHLVSVLDLSRDQMLTLYTRAQEISRLTRSRMRTILADRVLGVMFFQNSTRTRLSFETAAVRCGGKVVGFASADVTRSGDFFDESPHDAARIVGQYADCIVIRHIRDGLPREVAVHSPVPVINAGDGENEHPTQALLDVWTMLKSLGPLDGRRIGIVGDPACRALRSLIFALAKFPLDAIMLLPPEGASVTEDESVLLAEAGIAWERCDSAEELLRRSDLVSMIPFLLPDFHEAKAGADRKARLDDRYRFSRDRILKLASDVPILHTGPRGEELSPDVDDLPNVLYFDQARSGVHLRAALMEALVER